MRKTFQAERSKEMNVNTNDEALRIGFFSYLCNNEQERNISNR